MMRELHFKIIALMRFKIQPAFMIFFFSFTEILKRQNVDAFTFLSVHDSFHRLKILRY